MEFLKQYHRRHCSLRVCFDTLFEYFWTLWTKTQLAAQEESLEAQSLYRWKRQDHVIKDSDSYDEMLASFFPSFEQEFAGDDQPDVDSTQSQHPVEDSSKASCKQKLVFAERDIHMICSMHMLLHHKEPLRHLDVLQDPNEDLYHLASCCTSYLNALPGL